MSRSTLKDFDVLTRLGAGSFGTVYKVKRIIDDKLYVMKVVRIGELSHRERSDAINEVQILAQLKSPFVVCYYDSFIEKENLHIVMEFCNRGDLQNLLRKAKERTVSGLKEPIVWNMALQIILGLYYLHRKNILHRDLKSANVFLNKDSSSANYHLKIGDLGVAKLMDTSTALAQTIVGTPYYLSPELCKDMPYRDKSDCWALGVIIYECCTLEHPFEARNQCALIMKIIESPVKPPPASNASPILTNLILWLLQKDPRLRSSISDLLKEIEVRRHLHDEGFELPEELIDCETTNFLVEGLPAVLPKEVEEKSNTNDDGTISLMTTLVDEKDTNHRSFRVAATVLSAQSSNNRMNNDYNSNNNNNNNHLAIPVSQPRVPSGRFGAKTGTSAVATSGVPGPVKRTTSVTRANSTPSVSSTSSTVAVTAGSTTTSSATMVGNRVRGNNRGRGRITSDKARMRYQRPPVASFGPTTSTTATTGQASVTGVVDGDDEEGYDDCDAEGDDDRGMDIEHDIGPSAASGSVGGGAVAEAKALASHEVYGTEGAQRRPSVMIKGIESLRLADEKAAALQLAEPRNPQANSSIRGESKFLAIAAMDDNDEKYDSDFVSEEENDQYDVSHPPVLGKPSSDYKHTPIESKQESSGGATMRGTSSLSSYQHTTHNRSLMSTAGSEFGEHGTKMGNQTEDAEMWNSIWTEKRGMVGGAIINNNAQHHSSENADIVAGEDLDTADEEESVAVPIQEVEDMLVLARKKAIADLGEGLFSKIYSLLSRYMKQDHAGDGGDEGADEEQSLNLRMLQELEALLGEELQVHGVALVSDAVFRVRALLAFESKCSSFIPPTVATKEVLDKREVISQSDHSDLPTIPVPQHRHQQSQSRLNEFTADTTPRRK